MPAAGDRCTPKRTPKECDKRWWSLRPKSLQTTVRQLLLKLGTVWWVVQWSLPWTLHAAAFAPASSYRKSGALPEVCGKCLQKKQNKVWTTIFSFVFVVFSPLRCGSVSSSQWIAFDFRGRQFHVFWGPCVCFWIDFEKMTLLDVFVSESIWSSFWSYIVNIWSYLVDILQ